MRESFIHHDYAKQRAQREHHPRASGAIHPARAPSFSAEETGALGKREYTAAQVRQASRTFAVVLRARGAIWFSVTLVPVLVALRD
jgi:hypothetical protein